MRDAPDFCAEKATETNKETRRANLQKLQLARETLAIVIGVPHKEMFEERSLRSGNEGG
jgi:hypothetical protein